MAKLTAVTIPKWGIEMERGTIAEWRVAPGEAVAKGDELVDIETDKIINSFEASVDGILVRILAEPGEELNVGTLIGVMASEQVADAEIDAFIAAHTGKARAATAPAPAPAAPVAASVPAAAAGASATALRISPAMRRKAERLGVAISAIVPTGEGGRVLRDDVEAARSGNQPQSLKQLQGAQKTIAERMTLAKQTIPHFYLQRDCAMDGVLAAAKAQRAASGAAVTVNHLLVYAVARALQAHPELNLNVLPGGIRQLTSTDVAIAVETDDSLLTPVVRNIGEADVPAVAQAATAAVDRARNRQLAAGDLEGAAITVSNLGMLGVTSFTAIINPPQVMILAVGAIGDRVIMHAGQPAVQRCCTLSLACDHRVINGAAGARFLGDICEILEDFAA